MRCSAHRMATVKRRAYRFARAGVGCALALVVWGSLTVHAQGLDITITPGLGHDQFTETFYIDDTTSVSSDSLTRIRRTEDALRESFGSMGVDLALDRWELVSTTYATNSAWRNISAMRGRVQTGRLDARV
ncbi:MAG: hypothetical protein GF341_09370, partial [candidate division Zixibacteria bacterium]|nr:hypothetical protein [candidate division Zixibacteria bacterium]